MEDVPRCGNDGGVRKAAENERKRRGQEKQNTQTRQTEQKKRSQAAQEVGLSDADVRKLEQGSRLTIADVHSYYVLAGADPVLVHNCGGSVTGHPAKCECADGGVPQVRNGKLAGGVHPSTSVPFDRDGFPDFSAWRHPDVPDVNIELSGRWGADFSRANQAAGLTETPSGYTWRHHQRPGVMQLIETEVHKRTGHAGGFSGGRK